MLFGISWIFSHRFSIRMKSWVDRNLRKFWGILAGFFSIYLNFLGNFLFGFGDFFGRFFSRRFFLSWNETPAQEKKKSGIFGEFFRFFFFFFGHYLKIFCPLGF